MSGLLYLLDVYDALMGASAVAATSLLRYALAAAFPLFINPSKLKLEGFGLRTQLTSSLVYRNLGVGWATSVFGFISVGLAPIPWVFHLWGPKLRASSKMITT